MTSIVAYPLADFSSTVSMELEENYEMVDSTTTETDTDCCSTSSDTFVKLHCDLNTERVTTQSSINSVSSVPTLDEEEDSKRGSQLEAQDNCEKEQDNTTTMMTCATNDTDTFSTFEPIPFVNNIPFGGLTNLGNTCYMASALQMITAADCFVNYIRDNEPTLTQLCGDGAKPPLRTMFLNTIQRLKSKETVHPLEFKEALDDRTSLFVGYDQQDSHEFLTTLLDLIDLEYKRSLAASSVASLHNSDGMILDNNPFTDSPHSRCDEDNQWKRDSCEDKQELEQIHSDNTDTSVHTQQNDDSQKCASLSHLEFSDIELLLHGRNSNKTTAEDVSEDKDEENNHAIGKRCKLAGGRMIPSSPMVSPLNACKVIPHLTTQDTRSAQTSETCNPVLRRDDNGNEDTLMCESNDSSVSPVNDFFQTKVSVRLTCDSCKYTRTQDETYLHLSLEIGSPDTISTSIEDGIRRFFAPEKRDIKCEKCFSNVAHQTVEISKLPRLLLLHLKRFIVDVSPDYSSISYRKNQSPVSFMEEMFANDDDGVFSEFLSNDNTIARSPTEKQSSVTNKYRLRSVVNHVGSSASFGHYTADAIRQLEDGNNEWFRFNDDIVTKISSLEATEESSTTAYMVLYELE